MILTEGSEGSGGGVWRRALESGETIESEDDDEQAFEDAMDELTISEDGAPRVVAVSA